MTDEAVSSEGVLPKFTTELVTQEVLIGQPVTMSCDVIGTPTPDVTWYQVRYKTYFSAYKTAAVDKGFNIMCCSGMYG